MNQLSQVAVEEDEQRDKYLTFALDDEIYGLEIRHVLEIIGVQTITAVPELPDFLKGIINLRGQIIPVMDVRLRFKKEFRAYNDRTCIIVISIESTAIGLIVDRVIEVLSIPDSQIDAPPNYALSSNRYIQGIGKIEDEVKLLLDCHKLLNEQESAQLTQIN